MNSIWRQVLLILAILGGALSVILIYPRNSAPAQGPEFEGAPSASADSAIEEVSAPQSEKREPKRPETAPEIASAEQERSPGDPLILAGPSIPAPEPVTPDQAIERLLQKRVDLTDPLVRQDLVAKIQRLEAVMQRETREKASALGFPLRTEDGAVLVGFDGEVPLYDEDHNANAAITTGANLVQAAPFNASGSGFIFGLWEAGDVPRTSHQELFPRVTVIDGQTSMDMHASHVAGTLVAAGIDPLVRGMAPGASIKAHDTSSELSEMTALAAAAVGTPGAIYLSNHSYGSSVGWNDAKTAWYGSFSDDGDPGNDYSSLFGRYNSTASSWDGLAWNAPYYLIFKSAGNDRNDAAPAEGATWNLNGSPSNQYLYDSITHPVADYDWQTDGVTGFGTIGPRASAKNIITVGSMTDAVSSGVRNVGVASLNNFSSAGPTDDGRIKPDLMANGNSLRSLDKDSDTDQATASGTSMSTPNACGSAMLLIDYYNQLFPGQAMLSSSLKGLLIHTADDIGNPGPDYRHGWGLMNVTAAAQLLEDHANVVTGERLVEGELDGLNPEDEVTISHNGSGPLRVTICWTDPAGSSIASHNSRAKRLVHDLNLSVTGPAGTHLPYVMPWVDDWSNSRLDDPAVTGVNNVDNVEQVYLAAPVAGSYTIRVDHLGLAQGSQKYSLILSGAAIQTGPPVVTVVNPVDDMAFVGDSPATIHDVADVTSVFSAEAVTFEISASPAGILSAVIDGGNNVDLTPTTTAFGTVTVTLSATDANDNVAEDSFEVTIASPIFYVDASTPAVPGSQDGFSWATAYTHLQDALLLAQSGQEIWVAAGAYYPDLTNALDSGNKNDAFVVPAGVSVYGGFLPGDSSLDDADPWTNNVTLNGDIGGGQKSYNVVDLSACDATAVFDGFIITNGAATDASKHSGGGIYSNGGSATISRCQLTNNGANQKGGGICLLGGAPLVNGCEISSNVGNEGGGLYLDNSAGEILNCQVTNNTASVNGGGVCLIGGTPLVKGCTVSDNGGNRGGAFYLDNSAAKIVNCQSARNNAATDGGGMWTQNSSGVLVHGCEFRGNVGSGPGSLGVDGGSVSVVSSLFSGGQAWFGSGGVEIKAGSIDLINCTVTANYSWAQEGGGLLVSGATTGSNVYNCIIWNNQAAFATSNPGSSIGHSGAPDPQVHHSLVHNSAQSGAWSVIGFDGGGNIDVDPAFTAPIDPNGSGDDGGDFTVPANSAALNGGSIALLPADVADVDGDSDFGEASPLDLAGSPREVSTSVDMGAFEFGDLDLLDADNDGISDAYEFVHVGDYVSINPFDDLDGDGLTALAEFAHGLDPATGLSAPVGALTAADVGGVDYLTITYDISDEALNLLQITVERRTDLDDPYGWKGGETVLLSSDPVAGQPGMTRVVARSTVPFGTTRCEFLRIKHEQLP